MGQVKVFELVPRHPSAPQRPFSSGALFMTWVTSFELALPLTMECALTTRPWAAHGPRPSILHISFRPLPPPDGTLEMVVRALTPANKKSFKSTNLQPPFWAGVLPRSPPFLVRPEAAPAFPQGRVGYSHSAPMRQEADPAARGSPHPDAGFSPGSAAWPPRTAPSNIVLRARPLGSPLALGGF